MAQLTQLNLAETYLQAGWQHLPQLLRQLSLATCGLHEIPAELTGLTLLLQLDLSDNDSINGGWQHLPRQLQQLNLLHCGLQQVPAALAGRELNITGLEA